jgi:hypothetical protein
MTEAPEPVPVAKKPFVEPVVSAPENILDVTKRFAFQALSAETSGA